MCNFSSTNNNQSATSTNNTTPSAIELIKMAAELAAIDHVSSAGLYSPIPVHMDAHIKIGDFNISCNITNNAARDVDLGNKQTITQTTQQQKTTSNTSQQQASKATDNQQQKTTSNTSQQQASKATDNQQQKTTSNTSQQQEEKFRRLYSLITDFLGSYTKVKISIAPGCSTDSIRLGFINKGESVVKGERPFFGVESVSMQRYFSKNFEYFSIFPRGDAFSVTIKGYEAAVSKLMRMVEEHIIYNKRNVEWARYNN